MRYQIDSLIKSSIYIDLMEIMRIAGSSSGRTLDFESGYGRSNRSPAASLKKSAQEEAH